MHFIGRPVVYHSELSKPLLVNFIMTDKRAMMLPVWYFLGEGDDAVIVWLGMPKRTSAPFMPGFMLGNA